jgi:hypothetical protein
VANKNNNSVASPTQAKGIERATSSVSKNPFFGDIGTGRISARSVVRPKTENILKVRTIGRAVRKTKRVPTAITFVRNKLKSAIP